MDPLAALVGAGAVAALASALYKSLLDAVADARKARDDANARTDKAIKAGNDTIAAVDRLTDALERANRVRKPS